MKNRVESKKGSASLIIVRAEILDRLGNEHTLQVICINPRTAAGHSFFFARSVERGRMINVFEPWIPGIVTAIDVLEVRSKSIVAWVKCNMKCHSLIQSLMVLLRVIF